MLPVECPDELLGGEWLGFGSDGLRACKCFTSCSAADAELMAALNMKSTCKVLIVDEDVMDMNIGVQLFNGQSLTTYRRHIKLICDFKPLSSTYTYIAEP